MLIAPEVLIDPQSEKGLSFKAKQMQRSLFSLDMLCSEVAHLLSCTVLGQFETEEEARLRTDCKRVLDSLACVERELLEASGGGNPRE